MSLHVLLLAGGLSERMGRDKAEIVRPDGTRQIDHVVALARKFSDRVFLSTRDGGDRGTGLPVVADLHPGDGPVGALASAAATAPGEPWLVLGCDLFLLDEATLRHLLDHRDPSRPATAFHNRIDGKAEPLCAIYEASAMAAAAGAVRPADLKGKLRVSADLGRHAAWLVDLAELGFDQIHLHHVGQEDDPFLAMAADRLLPELRSA